MPLTIYQLKVFKAFSLSCPELIGKVKMGLSCIKNMFPFAIDDGSRVIEYCFSTFISFLYVSKEDICIESFGE